MTTATATTRRNGVHPQFSTNGVVAELYRNGAFNDLEDPFVGATWHSDDLQADPQDDQSVDLQNKQPEGKKCPQPVDRSVYKYTDAAFAETFAEKCDDYRYTSAVGWRHWNGRNWERDRAESQLWADVTQHLIAISRDVLLTDLGNVKHCLPKKQTISNVITHLQHIFTEMESVFQPPPHLLNCKNCIVDLRNGRIMSHSRTAFFDWCVDATYTPGKYNSEFVSLIDSMFPNTVSDIAEQRQMKFDLSPVAKYFHKSAGYSITGETREELCFYLHGKTRSGKGTVLNTISEIMGKHVATAMSFDSIEQTRNDPQNFRLAGLANARYLVISETTETGTLNERLIKTMTGRDQITAAHKGKDAFTYTPRFKLWIMSNFAINGKFDDDAFWGRFRLFGVTGESHLGKEDVHLKDRLLTGRDGILSWLIDGAIRYYNEGLTDVPDVMRFDLSKHRAERDQIAGWIEDRLTDDPSAITRLDDLFNDYQSWCDDSGIDKRRAKNGLSMTLNKRGYKSDRKKVDGTMITYVYGLKIGLESEPDQA